MDITERKEEALFTPQTNTQYYYPLWYKIFSTPYIRTTAIVSLLHVSHTYTIPILNVPTTNAMAGWSLLSMYISTIA